MIKLLILAAICIQTSLYSLHFTASDGTDIPVSSFQGKKMLLVNIATNSPQINQLVELEQLQETYKDSLVVIAFPTNSFNNESRNDSDIASFCQNNYHNTFLLAHVASVKGADIQPVFHWLTNIAENGVMQEDILNDYQKYLIDKDGNLIGVFANSVSPMSKVIQDAITSN